MQGEACKHKKSKGEENTVRIASVHLNFFIRFFIFYFCGVGRALFFIFLIYAYSQCKRGILTSFCVRGDINNILGNIINCEIVDS